MVMAVMAEMIDPLDHLTADTAQRDKLFKYCLGPRQAHMIFRIGVYFHRRIQTNQIKFFAGNQAPRFRT